MGSRIQICKLTDSIYSPSLYYIDIDEVRFVDPLYLEPGDSLHIEIVGDSVIYSGSRAFENQYFIDFNNVVNRDDDFYSKILSFNQDDLMIFMFDEMTKRIDFTKKYFSGKTVNIVFMNYLMARIEFSTARAINNYLSELKNRKLLKIDYDKLISDLSMITSTKQDVSLPIRSFKYYISDFVNILVKKDLADSMSIDDKWKNQKDIYSLMYEKSVSEFDDEICCFVCAFIVYGMVQDKSDIITLEKAKWMINDLTERKCSKYLVPVIDLVNQKESFLIKDAPDFELIDSKGNSVMLSSFRGKYVLLDFWGTWCPPCIEEIKHLELFQENHQYLLDSIVFIYLAMEHKNKENWEIFISKKKLYGYHIYLEHGWQNAVSKMYMIIDAPHYILIDKNGKIVSPNFHFPSNPKFKTAIDEILINSD